VDDGSTSPDRATTEITDLLQAHAAGERRRSISC
jgi:hypothetical protein